MPMKATPRAHAGFKPLYLDTGTGLRGGTLLFGRGYLGAVFWLINMASMANREAVPRAEQTAAKWVVDFVGMWSELVDRAEAIGGGGTIGRLP